MTPAADGLHHLEQGKPVRKLQHTCGPALRQETSMRRGGEALRQGRIGESPRNVGWPRACSLRTGRGQQKLVLWRGLPRARTSGGYFLESKRNHFA